ncbi:glycosyltransferase family 2 protein [Hyalangium gracile]|uniref:glycosyltransferase family 2 protein n=1 Tax=Hyalangium gracile TaxID=394092 RepID=UPI001CCF006C|nr:hypothetical protein [Hyalangium gracile]
MAGGTRLGVTVVMIPHNDEERALTRLRRDLLPSLALSWRLLDAELVVIDNSERQLTRLARAVRNNGLFPAKYRWNKGRNLYYGPAMNQAVREASRPFLLYVCANHGRMHDPTWIWDLLEPLVSDPSESVALTGSFYPSGPPSPMGFADWLEQVHVQGGVFAARTSVLARFPYPDGEYAHWGSDIYQSFQLQQHGYVLVDVPSVKSVWRSRVEGEHWKYVHDES